jgi:PAS domain S-box-containing protein
MPGAYDYGEVARSVLIAMAASYAALDLTGRVTAAKGRVRVFWLSGGATAMGIGIWAMHFKGMLAFRMPVPVAYHWPTVLASLLVAVFASAVALFVASRRKMGRKEALIGSIIMGGAIAGMHYVGVAAMRLPAIIRYSPWLVTASILLAILFSLIALRMAFGLRQEAEWTFRRGFGSALVMGVAISAMHYTGMAAASFIPASPPDLSRTVSISPLGNSGVALATVLVLLAAFVTSSVDRRAERKRAEDATRRSEKQLRDLIQTIPTMVFSIRPDGSTDFVSRNWQDFAGLSLENTTSDGWQATVHPDDLATHLNKWRASLASAEPFENEARHRSANGEYRWFLVRAVPLCDDPGRVLKWYGTLTDIEERKRAEALLTGEKLILEMVAKGNSLAQILDSLCRLVEEQASGVLASVLLVQGDRLRHGGAPSLPKAYTDAIDGVVIGPAVGSCGTAAYSRKQVIVEDIATDPLWADYREAALPHSLHACWSTPIFSSQGEVMATFAMYHREPRRPNLRDQGIIEQITHLAGVAIERKLTQEALRRSEAYLTEAQKLSKTGSWAYDPRSDQMIYCSEELYRIFDIDPQSSLPSIEALLQQVHPEDRDRVREASLRGAGDEGEHTLEYRLWLPDGTVKHVLSMRHPVLDEAGDLVQVIGTVIDVTERKLAEAEIDRLHQLEADLARINRVTTMGELTASLAHEINQPIAAAVTNANTSVRWLAGEAPNVGEAREAARRAAKDANRAAEIINRIRALFKKGNAQREWVDVNEIINELVVLLRNEAMRYNVSIHRQLSADLPQVLADRVQLQQVLMNLIANSIDAMKGADGTRELTLVSQRAGSDQVLVSVSDNGVGLPTEAGRIFNAFFTTKPHGTGMGLAISRSIIESHGGHLWASSNSGRGATFYFTLPTDTEAEV